MNAPRVVAFALGAALLALPARAQGVEIVPLASAGYTTGHGFENVAAGVEGVEVKGGFSWGGAAAWFFSPHFGAEASWMQQQTSLSLSNAAGRADLFDMNVGQLHGNLVYQIGGGGRRIVPFALAGVGVTFLSATDLETERKLSWAVGAGLKVFPGAKAGLRLQARYKATQLNDSDAALCDPFGFCADRLGQWEFTAGVVLRL